MKSYVRLLANSEDPDEMQHNAAFHLAKECTKESLVCIGLNV